MYTYVLASNGTFVQHGPRRSSEKQAKHVAGLLRRRLGWVVTVADSLPADVAADASAPTVAQAGCSPVWRDPALAARWNGVAAVAAPAPSLIVLTDAL